MRLLRNLSFLSVSLSHFVIDSLNGLPAILLAAFSVPLGLTNMTVGLLATLYGLAGAVFQPFFGLASDRFGGRWLSLGGLLWMGLFFGLVCIAQPGSVIPLLLLAGVGSGAFHPAGTMDATEISRRSLAGKVATGAAVFFLFGQLGSALGPAAGGALIDRAGRSGLLLVVGLCLPVAIITFSFGRSKALARGSIPVQAHRRSRREALAGVLAKEFILILLLAIIRFWVQASSLAFLPKFLMEQGYSATASGALAGVFMVGAAVGGMVGGVLGDRYGRYPIILGATALSVLPLYLYPVSSGLLLPVLIGLAGLLNVAPHSVLVTMAQDALPGRGGLASGMILGSMFMLGGAGVFLSGQGADRVGLTAILQANALLCALGVGIGLALWATAGRETTRSPSRDHSPKSIENEANRFAASEAAPREGI